MTDVVIAYTGYLFRRAQQAHVAAWQREVSDEVTSVQFGVLHVLAQRPGASQRELCQLLDLDRSTIADLVVRLERRGLIVRVRDDEDRRRNVLELTAAGSAELASLIPRVSRVDDVLTDELTGGEKDTLSVLLRKLLESPSVRALHGDDG